MSKFLLKIEDVFEIKGRGLILAPEINPNFNLPKSSKVSVTDANGNAIEAEATFEIPFINYSNAECYLKQKPAFTCILKDLSKESVQIGMQVWLK